MPDPHDGVWTRFLRQFSAVVVLVLIAARTMSLAMPHASGTGDVASSGV